MDEKDQIIDCLVQICRIIQPEEVSFENVLRLEPYLRKLIELNFNMKSLMEKEVYE